MTEQSSENLKYTGRIYQIGIYFKKFLRMFVYQSDWIVLPIGAIIAALVTFVVGGNMFVTQEGTTTAMTVMPFLLIYQLIFSGSFFDLGAADIIKVTTISHWGTDSLCAIGRYNEQPMVTLWNTMVQFKDAEFGGKQPILPILQGIEENDLLGDFLAWSGANNTKPAYESIASNVLPAWGAILLMIIIFTVVAVIALKLIDKDKR